MCGAQPAAFCAEGSHVETNQKVNCAIERKGAASLRVWGEQSSAVCCAHSKSDAPWNRRVRHQPKDW